MATLDELTERIRRAAAVGPPLTHTLKVDLRGEGVIRLQGQEVSNSDGPADLVVSVTRADLERLGKGELDPTRAMMTGRIKISDMSLALSLRDGIQALFARTASP